LVLKEVRWNKKEFLDMEVQYLQYLPCPVACRSGKWNRREVANQDLAWPAFSGGEEALERGEVTLGD
jgi:hypothetical protein